MIDIDMGYPTNDSQQNNGQQQNNYQIPDSMLRALGIGAGAGNAAGGLYNLFGHSQNPANGAMNYFNKITPQTQQYYQPYINAGQQALPQLQEQYGNLMNHPGEQYNKFASGYQESPGYKQRLEAALHAIHNSQAAGGMAGTLQHQQLAGEQAANMSAQDFENYLNHVSGLYGRGLQGTEGLNTMGHKTSEDFATQLANILSQKGQYAYAGQEGKNKQKAGGISDLFSGLGTAAGFIPWGGAFTGLKHLFGGK